ncbi:MAG: hypothetical protein K2P81_04555 [Bacteriovoracaceae bacterium]|nr:hypothetical protein [Bacteriovoracaceae bacterium]
MVPCPKCGKNVPYLEAFPPGRTDQCTHCGCDLRSCVACKHYDKAAYNECHEPSADRVVDKEKANFCEWFKFGPKQIGAGTTKEDMLEKAKSLFKK